MFNKIQDFQYPKQSFYRFNRLYISWHKCFCYNLLISSHGLINNKKIYAYFINFFFITYPRLKNNLQIPSALKLKQMLFTRLLQIQLYNAFLLEPRKRHGPSMETASLEAVGEKLQNHTLRLKVFVWKKDSSLWLNIICYFYINVI